MTEKKYRVHDLVKFDYSQIKQYVGVNYTDRPLRNDEVVDLLNSLDERIKLQSGIITNLKKENEQLKKELKRCKDWINSDKNDYELTLAFIKNKGYSLKDVLEYEKRGWKND